jgi:hypothetical protein
MDSDGRISWARSSPGPLRSFDPSRVAGLECAAWVAYYRRRWLRLLVAAVGLVRAGLGLSWPATVRAAWFALRAIQLWAPVPANDPERARRFMRRFYALVGAAYGQPQDPAESARLEVEWWRVHREAQQGFRAHVLSWLMRSRACMHSCSGWRNAMSARRRSTAAGRWRSPTNGSPGAAIQAARCSPWSGPPWSGRIRRCSPRSTAEPEATGPARSNGLLAVMINPAHELAGCYCWAAARRPGGPGRAAAANAILVTHFHLAREAGTERSCLPETGIGEPSVVRTGQRHHVAGPGG